jgi:aminoglycoside phosphotransferase (APT) family kinase protein
VSRRAEPDASTVAALGAFLDERLGGHEPVRVESMAGGGSCEVFAVDRAGERWVLRRAPRHASSATAHDVLREHRILAAIADAGVRIARPVVACADAEVFGAPFYVMQRIDGVPVRGDVPEAWTAEPATQGRAVEELVDALAEIHAVDWRAVGLGDLGHPDAFLERQVARWLSQLESYGGRPLPVATDLGAWLEQHRPPEQPPSLFHGDYKLDNVLFAADAPPRLLAVVDWEMASIGDPLVDLAWALIFHPAPGATMPLGAHGDHRFDVAAMPSSGAMIARYAERSGRDVSAIAWYHVFARWKLAIVLEGSYAKFVRGESDKPIHEHFGRQADVLLASAAERAATGGSA